MRVLIVCTCRNDVDTLELSVKHNLQFCDSMLVVNRNSVDGSRRILADLQREGLPIVVFDDPRLGFDEWTRVSRLSRNARRFLRPDRILLLNADELIMSEDRSTMEKELQGIELNCAALVARRNLRPETPPGDRIVRYLQRNEHYSTAETWLEGRILISEEVDEWESSELGESGHSQQPPTKKLRSFSLARLPFRSGRRMILNAVQSWLDNELIELTVRDAEAFRQDLSTLIANESNTEALPVSLFRGGALGQLVANWLAPGRSRDDTLLKLRELLDQAVVSGRESAQERVAMDKATTGEVAVAESGSLGAEFHRHNLYLDLPPFRLIWDTYRPRTVLDLGCGLGGYLEMFRRWGAEEVFGVDDFEEPEELLVRGSYRHLDLRETCNLGRTYDLVLCTEVLEHIDKSHESIVLSTIANHAKDVIVFSAARPGQPGVGHINCQTPEYWIEKWKNLGWVVEPFGSLAMRSLSTFYWFRRNLVVFVREDHRQPPQHGFKVEDLDSVEARFTPWLGEAPCVHTFPLAVDLPRLDVNPENADED